MPFAHDNRHMNREALHPWFTHGAACLKVWRQPAIVFARPRGHCAAWQKAEAWKALVSARVQCTVYDYECHVLRRTLNHIHNKSLLVRTTVQSGYSTCVSELRSPDQMRTDLDDVERMHGCTVWRSIILRARPGSMPGRITNISA